MPRTVSGSLSGARSGVHGARTRSIGQHNDNVELVGNIVGDAVPWSENVVVHGVSTADLRQALAEAV